MLLSPMRIIEPSEWRAQPWRNGAGVTHEVLRWPEAAGGEGEPFGVRISVAEITAPAPFSAFAGYRRWLYLVGGGPVTLVHEEREVVLAAPGEGLAFDGSARMAAVTVARPSRDLNFMVREGLRAEVRIVGGAGGAGGAGAGHALEGDAVCVFAIAGEAAVAAAGGGRRTLGASGCAWVTGARVEVVPAPGAICAVLAVSR